MPSNLKKLSAKMVEAIGVNGRLAGLPCALFKRSVSVLFLAGFAWLIPWHDAFAHSGHFPHGNVSRGQLHHGGFNSNTVKSGNFEHGQFHPGHFHHYRPHGSVILVPPLAPYYPPPVYYCPSVNAVQTAPTTIIENELDGTTISYRY